MNGNKISLNVLLSCDLIGQLCAASSSYGSCRNSVLIVICRRWYYKEIDFMTFIAFAETTKTVHKDDFIRTTI